jgi:hypothetical protein
MIDGIFVERFVYVCLLLFLVALLVGWPTLYGTRVFDPEFSLVSLGNPGLQQSNAAGHCDSSLHKGPIFLAGPGLSEWWSSILPSLCE